MALRARSRVLLSAAGTPPPESASVLSGEGGLRGLLQRVRARVVTGKLLRPDVEDDVLRKPVAESRFRHPSPGAQQPPVVPQGPYENVFDIAYHSRDSRRLNLREELSVEDAAAKAGLPPTPGKPVMSTFLGLAADFDRKH